MSTHGTHRPVPGVELHEELGRGARSVVYRGRRDGRDVAVKLLRSAGDEREAVAFRREAALLASLDGVGLPAIHEVGQAGDRPYLVMDLVTGTSLAEVVGTGVLDEARTVRLAMQVTEALAAAHQAGLVHRDVKPANIMVGADGRAKLIDFGLAGRAGIDVGDAAVGTFTYSAPEQTGMLRRPVDGRSDLYSLGATMFEALTGVAPFGVADVGELLRMHLSVPAPDLRASRPDVSPALAAVVARLLAKDPDDRYQSAAGLLADLGRIAAGERAEFALEAAVRAGPAAEPVMVGRAAELAGLRARWQEAAAGRGGVAVAQGPPGAGKSRLVRELAATARSQGHLVLHGKCSADDAVPLAPVRAALTQLLHHTDRLAPEQRAAAHDRIRAAAGDCAGLLATLSPGLTAVLGRQAEGGDVGPDGARQFAGVIARFLVDLAEAHRGGILHLDDLQWADQATREVLGHLAAVLGGSRLLLVATARDDPDGLDAVEALLADVGAATDPPAGEDADVACVSVGPLDAAAVQELITGQLGSRPVPPELVDRLAARGGGNPLAVQEYLRAVVDAGLLRPFWGTWIFDTAGLDELALPDDVLGLVLRRVDRLGPEAGPLLSTAAAVGTRFPPALVAAVCEVEPAAAATAFADAAAHGLVEPADGGGYAFLHDRIREALLAELDATATRALHQRIAEELERGGVAPVYEIAQHYLRGETARTPEPAFRAAAAAGALALAEHAAADAVDYLVGAAAVAGAAGIVPDVAFHTDLGTAASRAGQFLLAREHLVRALELQRDRPRRAVLFGELAAVDHARSEGDQGVEMVFRALAELGHPIPRNPVLMAVSTLALTAFGVLVGWLPSWLRAAGPATRERLRLRADLSHIGAESAGVASRQLLMAGLALRALPLVNRLGPGPQYAVTYAQVAILVRVLGWRRLAHRIAARAADAAAMTGDVRLVARIRYGRAILDDLVAGMDGDTGDSLAEALDTHGRRLDAGEFLTAAGVLGQLLLLRGYPDKAMARHAQALAGASERESLGNLVGTLPGHAAALRGHAADAARHLRELRDYLQTIPTDRSQRHNLSILAVHIAVEQGEVGDVFERAVATCDALRRKPGQLWPFQRAVWIHVAFGRLAQAAAAPVDRRAEPLAAATRAVRDLRSAAYGPVQCAYYRVATASLRQLRDDDGAALRLLSRIEATANGLDAPLLGYEMARVRARAYRGLGRRTDAVRQAEVALMLATRYDWVTRARWIRTEFDIGAVSTTGTRHSVQSGGAAGLHQRRLKALQQVSLAAATILDQRELARVALDEIVRIFGAERAFLFLHRADDDRLVPYLGRDSDGGDLDQLTGYGSTLVERVRHGHEALVVTGSEEGAALGSQSALVHGLRSVMVAPLSIKGRLLGVVYLDSRAAKGIFVTDDVDILVVIANQVAVSLETARAAQLELAVGAAERERDLAEMLHAAMTDLTASLDPDEVSGRLLGTVSRALPVDGAYLLRRHDDGGLTVAAVLGAGAGRPATTGARVDPTEDRALAGLLTATAPCQAARDQQPPPLPDLLGPRAARWLAVPLTLRSEHRGLLVAGTDADRPYTDAEVQIVAALAGQGLAALDNALLFRRVQEFATRDGLTGLFNRRHFLDLATQAIRIGQRAGRPAVAVMVDIDHFKAINDTHGHPIGDVVIREVAQRLEATLRGADIICRYGGEEFAVLLPDTPANQVDGAVRRLHEAVTAEPVLTSVGPLPVTVSIGFAGTPDAGCTVQDLLTRADEALYEAKRAGRNRVVGVRVG